MAQLQVDYDLYWKSLGSQHVARHMTGSWKKMIIYDAVNFVPGNIKLDTLTMMQALARTQAVLLMRRVQKK